MAPARTHAVISTLIYLATQTPWTTQLAWADAPQSPSQIEIGLLETGPSAAYTQAAIARLSWELRQRTSVKTALQPLVVQPTTQALMQTPVAIWRASADPGPLGEADIVALRRFVQDGGSLLIDAHDSDTHGPFASAVKRELPRIFADTPLLGVAADHVIFKSFYLAQTDAGRHSAGGPAMGLMINQRLAVLVLHNDLLGAFSPRADGGWALAVAQGQEQRREMALRMAMNWLMYALCLDYKEDQVHLPFILRRRP